MSCYDGEKVVKVLWSEIYCQAYEKFEKNIKNDPLCASIDVRRLRNIKAVEEGSREAHEISWAKISQGRAMQGAPSNIRRRAAARIVEWE